MLTSLDKSSLPRCLSISLFSDWNLWNESPLLEVSKFCHVIKLFLNWRIIALQCCVGFCQTPKWIRHIYPLPPEPPPPPWPHPASRGCHRSSRLSSLCPCSSCPLGFLHKVVYICQYHFLNSSHPPLPPRCPQVCSLCLCLYSRPENRVISTILLSWNGVSLKFLSKDSKKWVSKCKLINAYNLNKETETSKRSITVICYI